MKTSTCKVKEKAGIRKGWDFDPIHGKQRPQAHGREVAMRPIHAKADSPPAPNIVNHLRNQKNLRESAVQNSDPKDPLSLHSKEHP
jgi:hypothetical protein